MARVKRLVELPPRLKSGQRIKSRKGASAYVVDPRKRDREGNRLYRLRYIHTFASGARHVVRSDRYFTHQDLVNAGCRLQLTRKQAEERGESYD